MQIIAFDNSKRWEAWNTSLLHAFSFKQIFSLLLSGDLAHLHRRHTEQYFIIFQQYFGTNFSPHFPEVRLFIRHRAGIPSVPNLGATAAREKWITENREREDRRDSPKWTAYLGTIDRYGTFARSYRAFVTQAEIA